MAAPSLHVISGFAGGDGGLNDKQAIFKDPQWSEEPATGTPTTKGAADKGGMRPVMRVTNTVDVYVSIGSTPNAAQSPRHLLLAAHAPHDLYVAAGDKLAWVAA